MFDRLKADMTVDADIVRHNGLGVVLDPKATFVAELWRNNKLLKTFPGHNALTTEGKNHLLDVVYSSGTPVATWYIGLVDNTNFSQFNIADTLANHTGWDELVPATDYTGNRQAWVEGSASAGSKTSTSDSTFPILTTQTVHGILVCSAATGTTGTLMSTGAFDSTIDVQNGDSLKVSYTITY